MNILQVEYFVKVCEHKRISSAAKDLYISEQALSKSISQLERELGFNLFLRTSRGLELTEMGKAFYEKALSTVSAMQDLRAIALMAQKGEIKDTISFGAYENFLGSENDPFPARMLMNLAREFPDISLKFCEESNGQISSDVIAGKLDLGVIVGAVPVVCKSKKIARLNLCAFVSRRNELSKKEKLTWEDFDGQKLLHIRGKESFADDIYRVCERVGAKPISGSITTSSQLIFEFVYEDAGIVILDRRYERILDKRKAVMLPIDSDSELIRPSISIIWRDDFELDECHKRLIDELTNRVNSRTEEVKYSFD